MSQRESFQEECVGGEHDRQTHPLGSILAAFGASLVCAKVLLVHRPHELTMLYMAKLMERGRLKNGDGDGDQIKRVAKATAVSCSSAKASAVSSSRKTS